MRSPLFSGKVTLILPSIEATAAFTLLKTTFIGKVKAPPSALITTTPKGNFAREPKRYSVLEPSILYEFLPTGLMV